MTMEEKNAYSLIIDLLNDRHGPIEDDSQWLARVCGKDCSVRKWNTLRKRLIEMGKIVVDNNSIDNPQSAIRRLCEEKEHRKLSENGAKGGRNTSETLPSSLHNNGLSEKGLNPTRDQTLYTRTSTCLGKNEIEKKWLLKITDFATERVTENGGDIDQVYNMIEARARGEKWAVDRVNELDKEMRAEEKVIPMPKFLQREANS